MNQQLIKLVIDNHEIEVEPGTTVLQAAGRLGIEIPRFCYHERLSISGNCRMCLVEMEKSPKPIASCAMPAGNGMIIHTNTPATKKARENVLEFLLVNHPLDCPICDQGGECDLQDQVMAHGSDRGRFYDYKRAVEDKECGPLIKTVMTRCIHCTRCVRFITEVSGVEQFGTTGRGRTMEIGTYIKQNLTSELSGNIVDLCPVGALTSKPYAFVARPWELRHVDSIDVLDAVGANVRVDVRGNEIMRILPRFNNSVNEEWLADKGRYAHDAVRNNRIDVPYIRSKNKLVQSTWKDVFNKIKQILINPSDFGIILGKELDLQTAIAAKDLMARLGSDNLYIEGVENTPSLNLKTNYLLNSTIEGLENSTVCLLVGVDPKKEAPLLNARLRKTFLKGNLIVANVGTSVNLTYPTIQLGDSLETVHMILEGRHPFCQLFSNRKNPIVILGSQFVTDQKYASIINGFKQLKKHVSFNLNVLHKDSGLAGLLSIGFTSTRRKELTNLKIIMAIGVKDMSRSQFNDSFVIYQGAHGSSLALESDIVLPGITYLEKEGLYVNTEGRPQETKLVVTSPKESRSDWKIIRALSESLGYSLPYNTQTEINERLVEIDPSFGYPGVLNNDSSIDLTEMSIRFNAEKISSQVTNYYLDSCFSQHSKTMRECSKQLLK